MQDVWRIGMSGVQILPQTEQNEGLMTLPYAYSLKGSIGCPFLTQTGFLRERFEGDHLPNCNHTSDFNLLLL